ncbi:DUF1850 domain-containing protein [Lysinibacillus sp. NPDC096418]|uniref:DUF1850 domain-containing protein n=1 Tax=Lysinibacillus sp. NPDC096418 TaxID=3364138 RepID=UPI003811566E
MRKKSLLVGILSVVGMTIVFLPLQKVFAFTETRTDQSKLHYISATSDNSFRIRYTHSIHKSDVLEHYQYTEDSRIQMLGMEYEDLAIGMPGYAEEGQRLTQHDGKYYLQFEEAILENFTIYIGDLDIDLVFEYEGLEYDLKKDLQRGKSYLFQVKKVSLYEQWKGVRMK